MSKTLIEKLAAAKALVAKYEAAIAAEAITNNIERGDAVVIKFGRGNTARNVSGTVVGVADTDNGRFVAVLGDNLDTYKVHVRDVIENASAIGRSTVTEEATPDVAEVAVDEADAAALAAFENDGGAIAADDPLNEA